MTYASSRAHVFYLQISATLVKFICTQRVLSLRSCISIPGCQRERQNHYLLCPLTLVTAGRVAEAQTEALLALKTTSSSISLNIDI